MRCASRQRSRRGRCVAGRMRACMHACVGGCVGGCSSDAGCVLLDPPACCTYTLVCWRQAKFVVMHACSMLVCRQAVSVHPPMHVHAPTQPCPWEHHSEHPSTKGDFPVSLSPLIASPQMSAASGSACLAPHPCMHAHSLQSAPRIMCFFAACGTAYHNRQYCPNPPFPFVLPAGAPEQEA